MRWLRRRPYDRDVRPAAFTVALALYTSAMLVWLLVVGQVTLLEADHFDRFVRLSGWPTRVAAVGLVWTALLVAAVAAALRAPRPTQTAALATATLAATAVTLVVPRWFRGVVGDAGISTSEFLDAFFPLLGGILPGGQATAGLWITCAALGVLALASALSAAPRPGAHGAAPPRDRDG